MAFRYGQNYQTVHTYNEIQHIDIEPYKYTLKLQIYISNRIHTIRNYTYVHPYCMHVNRVHIHPSYTFIHRAKYIYIEIAHIYIEPNTHTSKLHIYKWYCTN